MNKIQLVGQVISSTNYATSRLFNFNPELIKEAAENFLASGVSEIEIPEGVLDPDGKNPETGIDESAVQRTIGLLPAETRMIGTYFGNPAPGDQAAFLRRKKQAIDHLVDLFPHFTYGMLHPPRKTDDPDEIKRTVAAWAELAEYAAARKPGVQLCLHNHYDSGCETAEQVRAFLAAIEEAAVPGLRWGPDTGHCHGMGDQYLQVLKAHAGLIGGYFHIKARIPAFDKLHGGALYAKDRDIWGGKAEVGTGLYSGFVNVADPEIQTPFREVFAIIRRKAQPPDGVVRGAVEIDVPRQHPRLEIMCSTLYLKTVHRIEPAMRLTCAQIVKRVFAP